MLKNLFFPYDLMGLEFKVQKTVAFILLKTFYHCQLVSPIGKKKRLISSLFYSYPPLFYRKLYFRFRNISSMCLNVVLILLLLLYSEPVSLNFYIGIRTNKIIETRKCLNNANARVLGKGVIRKVDI